MTRGVLSAAAEGESPRLEFLLTVPPLLYWLALFPAILWLGARLPLRRGTVLPSIALHTLAAGALATLYAELMTGLLPAWSPEPLASAAREVSTWPIRFQIGLLTYGFVLSWAYVHEYFTGMRERDVALARLETELAQAQLRALKAQLQPHFLFNTLHAITVLIRHDPEAAGRMVVRLSDLLRLTLVDPERQETTLDHELRFLRLYLEIEQTRFRDRLRIRWEIDSGLQGAAVPTLLLQPLVENAIKHGIGARTAGGTIVIGASRRNGALELRISDDGPGLPEGERDDARRGIGLASTRDRLELLYGASHRLEIGPGEAGGVRVTVGLPYRRLETDDG